MEVTHLKTVPIARMAPLAAVVVMYLLIHVHVQIAWIENMQVTHLTLKQLQSQRDTMRQ